MAKLSFYERKALLQLHMSGGMLQRGAAKSKRIVAMLERLDAAGLVELDRDFMDSAPLTDAGRAAIGAN